MAPQNTAPGTAPDTTFSSESALFAAMENEAPWFRHLRSAYSTLDNAIAAQLERLRQIPACGPACAFCCLQPIPASLPEILAIRLFLKKSEHAVFPKKDITAAAKPPIRTRAHNVWTCPFLQEDACAIYPVRPFICRNFLVFGQRCTKEEDPTATRPHEVFRPSENALLHALRLTLPVYHVLGHTPPPNADRQFFTRHTALLQEAFASFRPWPGNG